MSLDAYSYCPGGRGKKIRFCCPDLVKELQQIEKMMEDDQHAACLAYIEGLEKNKPDCACLTAAKLSMLRAAERWDESLQTAKAFREREPDNPLACSELAISYTFNDQWEEAISTMIDGIEKWEETSIHSSLLTGLLVVGEKALADGNVIPALCIARQLQLFQHTAQAGFSLYVRALRSDLPLIAKEMTFNPNCPADFPALEAFQMAANYVVSARWKKGLAILESLSQYAKSWPEIWRNIALLQLCFGQIDKAVDSLSRYSACEKCSPEDASDAELLRLCMIPKPLGDQIDILNLVCNINDAEKVQEILLSEKRCRIIPFDPESLSDGENPPPKNVFAVLDRPLPEKGTELTLDNISSRICDCLLFGKQTDREARIELGGVPGFQKEQVVTLLTEMLGSHIINWEEPVVLSSVSETVFRLRPRFSLDQDFSEDVNALRNRVEAIFSDEFAAYFRNRSFGLLEDKTPAECAADPRFKIRLLGMIEVIEYWLPETLSHDLCNRLRSDLGLPTHDPIPVPPERSRSAVSPSQEHAEGVLTTFLDEVPIWRWYRVDVKALPLEALIHGIEAASVLNESHIAVAFSKELLSFPFAEVPYAIRREAIRWLIQNAQVDSDLDLTLSLIEQAKNEAAQVKESDAMFNILEIPLRLALADTVKAQEVITHVLTAHRNEREAMEQIQQLFVNLGLMNPDGTPAAMPQHMQPTEPQPAEPASKLWVPD